MDAWVKSAASDYVGQPISLVAEALPAPLDADMGLLFESEMKRYGISAALSQQYPAGRCTALKCTCR